MGQRSSITLYFEEEGRQNFPGVLRVLKRTLKRRPELRTLPLVIFTSTGEGPAVAFSQLHQFEPTIIAVTFPPDFSVKRGEERYSPSIPEKLAKFFDGVGIKVITGRLPFDRMDGLQTHNEHMQLIQSVLSVFGGGFALSVQAVLAACDANVVKMGQKVIAITGDTAAIMIASTTSRFLAKSGGLAVNEILCKPRNLTISRSAAPAKVIDMPAKFEDKVLPKLLNAGALTKEPPKQNE